MEQTLISRLRTACSPESPLGKLCTEAADELEKTIKVIKELKFASFASDLNIKDRADQSARLILEKVNE